MTVLVTGAAGFIGMHVAEALLARGEAVLGVDNLNPYYDVALKHARLEALGRHRNFRFELLDISDSPALRALARQNRGIDRIINLAAQAGVRYSLSHPEPYIAANVAGHLNVLEVGRMLDRLDHLVYASSSSVYGGNTKLPFSIDDPVDRPVSLYAASKRAAELISFSYAHLHRLPQTGLRFFTVYGPWGRPDMSAYLFTKAILAGEPIRVFNHGDMKRDFTYIDDVVAGVVAALDRPPTDGDVPHRLYNLGNHRSEKLLRFIEVIEQAIGRKAELKLEPMQPGDVKETFADIEASRRDLGFEPKTPIETGIPNFVAWFRAYHKV